MRAMTWTKMAARAALVSAPLAFALFASAPAVADGVQGAHAPTHVTRETTREIRVALDQAVAVRLAGAANGISIGNPSIAGVSVQNDHLLFVTGRSYGSTNLIVLGPDDHAPLFIRAAPAHSVLNAPRPAARGRILATAMTLTMRARRRFRTIRARRAQGTDRSDVELI